MNYKHLREKTEFSELIKKYDSFMFDCDGVIWHGDILIENVKLVLEHLRSIGKKLIFVTNNATKSRIDIKKKFDKLGLHVEPEEIVGSAYATALYISRILKLPKDKKVYVIGEKGLEDELATENIAAVGGTDPDDNKFISLGELSTEITSDPSVGAVVCGLDVHITYKKLAKAHRYLMENPGCHFILTNADSTLPNSDGYLYPGSGSISAPLRNMVSKKPVIVGKPNKPMLDTILERHHLDPKRTIMIGDRLDTDILFGQSGGASTAMVLTGVSKLKDVQPPQNNIVPEYVLDSLGDLAVLAK